MVVMMMIMVVLVVANAHSTTTSPTVYNVFNSLDAHTRTHLSVNRFSILHIYEIICCLYERNAIKWIGIAQPAACTDKTKIVKLPNPNQIATENFDFYWGECYRSTMATPNQIIVKRSTKTHYFAFNSAIYSLRKWT